MFEGPPMKILHCWGRKAHDGRKFYRVVKLFRSAEFHRNPNCNVVASLMSRKKLQLQHTSWANSICGPESGQQNECIFDKNDIIEVCSWDRELFNGAHNGGNNGGRKASKLLEVTIHPQKHEKMYIIGDTAFEILSKYILRYYFMAALMAALFWNIGLTSISLTEGL